MNEEGEKSTGQRIVFDVVVVMIAIPFY